MYYGLYKPLLTEGIADWLEDIILDVILIGSSVKLLDVGPSAEGLRQFTQQHNYFDCWVRLEFGQSANDV